MRGNERDKRGKKSKKRGRARLGLALLLVCTAAVLFGVGEVSQRTAGTMFERSGEVQIIAHRAGAGLGPENTLAALERSIQAGADVAEIDVRMTGDGAVVALHDSSLERTAGLCCEIRQADCQTVQSLDAGGWFSPRFRGEKIPTLVEMAGAARGRIGLMIEVKCGGQDRETVEAVVGFLRREGLTEQCVLACADPGLLRRSKELASELDTVCIGAELTPELLDLDHVDGYSIALPGLTKASVSAARSLGRTVCAWTVNTQREMEQAMALGVDGLVSDDPELVAVYLGRNTGERTKE